MIYIHVVCITRYSLCQWKHWSHTIDLDSSSHLRDDVIELIKKSYGYDNVLPMATYTTEGTPSAVLSTCRGLGIDSVVANQIKNTLNTDDLHAQIYGDKEKNIKPNKSLISILNDYSEYNLERYLLAINGLISGRSQHASGVVVFNNGYIEDGLAMMKTKSGNDVTCFNADEVEFLGGLKIDILSTDALTRMMATIDLLIEDGLIEDQGSLRKTYNKYIHPDVIDYSNQEMYDMLYNCEVISACQFSTDVGTQSIRKVNAREFDELATANTLMRLTTKNKEQPIDKYVRFKNDINDWYKEMSEYNLSEDEVETLKRILLPTNGICSTQEVLMRLLMDENISNYPLQRANKFRSLATKSKVDILKKQEYPFFKKQVLSLGHSQDFVDYIWNECFVPQMQYSFAEPHIVGYTIITVQEMNLAYYYTPLYWQTACLMVDSGGFDEGGSIDYGAIARAVNGLREKVTTPDVNLSNRDFTPNREDDLILFGIQPIRNLTNDTIEKIFKNRPFKNFDDFYNRMVETGEISQKQTVIIIKSGMFNRIEGKGSRDIMIDFVSRTIPEKDKLTMSQFEKVYENGFIDQQQYEEHYLLYMYRKKLRSKAKKDKNFYDYFLNNYSKNVSYEIRDNGVLDIDKNSFEKYYDSKMEVIRNLLNSQRVLDLFNQKEKQEFWIENCMGSPQKWEVETISFFSDKHELDNMNLQNYFSINNFNEMEDGAKGVISGTIIDKNPQKNIVYISTQYGVVSIKVWKNVYNQYNEVITNNKSGKDRIVYENSWFDVGNTLVFVGFKRGEQFFLSNKGTNYTSLIYKINGFLENGDVYYASSRVKVD